jgi:hypothetical protein
VVGASCTLNIFNLIINFNPGVTWLFVYTFFLSLLFNSLTEMLVATGIDV